MTTKLRMRLAIVAAFTLTLAGCTTMPSDNGGQSSAACAAPLMDLTPATPSPGEPLSITVTNMGPCNDTIEENSLPPWVSVTLEWVQDGETVVLGTVDVTDGRIETSVDVQLNAVSGEASLRIVTPDPGYEQDFPVSVD